MKRFKKIMAIVLTIFLLGALFAVPAAAEQAAGTVKVANITVSSSPEDWGWVKAKLIDGIYDDDRGWTTWPLATTADKNEWAVFELESTAKVNQVDLYARTETGTGFPVDFTLQVSTDGQNYTTVVDKKDFKTDGKTIQSFTFDAADAKFIKLDATKLGPVDGSFGVQLLECVVFGEATASTVAEAAEEDKPAAAEENANTTTEETRKGTLEDFMNLSGFLIDGNPAPAELKLTDRGVEVLQPNGGHYDGGGNYTGVIFNTPVDLEKGAVIEFTIDKNAGIYPAEDVWYGLHFLNQKQYFEVANPDQSQGLVTLIRPFDDGMHFLTYQLIKAFGQVSGDVIEETKTEAQRFVVEFKNSPEGYIMIVNDQEQSAMFPDLQGVFKDGKAYIAMGASTANGKPLQFTIHRINNVVFEAVSSEQDNTPKEDNGTKPAEVQDEAANTDNNAAAQTENKTEEAVAEKADENNPKTGDAGMIAYAVIAAAGVAGTVVLRKRKNI